MTARDDMTSTELDMMFDPALSMARQAIYRFTALALVDPQAGSWEPLAGLQKDLLLSDAAALIRDLPEARPKELAMGEHPLQDLRPDRVLARLPDSSARLNAAYEHTFGLLVCNACPPYETEYISSKLTFQRSNALADINGFYRAFGVATSEALKERPDHIVQELEFMALLIGLERDAERSHTPLCQQRREVCRSAQERFLREHLAWWAPAFARLLARENPTGFYAGVAMLLAALIPAERALLHVAACQTPANPSSVELPEACAGCMGGSLW